MFLGQMDKPDVDYIDGLSPAISIDQKTTSRNPRSTVGTVTEIYDYLRLLWARIGTPHCPKCGKEIRQQTIDQIVDQVHGAAGGDEASDPCARSCAARRASTSKVFEDARSAAAMSACAWTAASTTCPRRSRSTRTKSTPSRSSSTASS